MKKFTLHWVGGGETTIVRGTDIADAVQREIRSVGALHALDYYEDEQGNKIQVAGQAPCNCVFHAEDGTSCPHDLIRVGL